MVSGGLEPPRPKARPPRSRASASSARRPVRFCQKTHLIRTERPSLTPKRTLFLNGRMRPKSPSIYVIKIENGYEYHLRQGRQDLTFLLDEVSHQRLKRYQELAERGHQAWKTSRMPSEPIALQIARPQ